MITLSCIVACFNAEATLEVAVRSALSQVNVQVEVIIFDDCSTDGSFNLAQTLATADSRVRVLTHAKRGGPSRARNKAIAAATGEWIAILDADDQMAPHRLADLARVAASERCDIVFDNQQIIDDMTQHQSFPRVAFDYDDGQVIDVATFLRLSSTRPTSLSIGYAKPIFAMSFLKQHGLHYDERFSVGEDWKLFLTALAVGGRCVYVANPMYRYYRPTHSITRSGHNNYRDLLSMTMASQKDLRRNLHPREQWAVRALCLPLFKKATARSLQNTVRSVKAVMLRRGMSD